MIPGVGGGPGVFVTAVTGGGAVVCGDGASVFGVLVSGVCGGTVTVGGAGVSGDTKIQQCLQSRDIREQMYYS